MHLNTTKSLDFAKVRVILGNMRQTSKLSVIFGMIGGLAAAECPPAPDHTIAIAGLISQARAAESERQGREFGAQMWVLWAKAPNEQAQAILNRGMSKRRAFDMLGAIADFDVLVNYCPEYAEGYNQRAFANFLQGKYQLAVVDLIEAIKLSPNHVAARAGLALTYMELGELDAARDELRLALELNPWLSERHLLSKGGRLAPKGEDI